MPLPLAFWSCSHTPYLDSAETLRSLALGFKSQLYHLLVALGKISDLSVVQLTPLYIGEDDCKSSPPLRVIARIK